MKSSFCSCAGDIQCLVDYILYIYIIWYYLDIFGYITQNWGYNLRDIFKSGTKNQW